MVSKARLDLADRERPVTTSRRSRGIWSEMFLRLCTRAPWTAIVVLAEPGFRLWALGFEAVVAQVLVQDDGVMPASVRVQGKPWDRPGVGPSDLPVQLLRRGSPLRVQCQEAEPGAARRTLNGVHQFSTQARAAAPAMHEQLRNLAAMRLDRRPGRVELDGTDDPYDI